MAMYLFGKCSRRSAIAVRAVVNGPTAVIAPVTTAVVHGAAVVGGAAIRPTMDGAAVVGAAAVRPTMVGAAVVSAAMWIILALVALALSLLELCSLLDLLDLGLLCCLDLGAVHIGLCVAVCGPELAPELAEGHTALVLVPKASII